jgi:uncharacterized protein with HEPN domain
MKRDYRLFLKDIIHAMEAIENSQRTGGKT